MKPRFFYALAGGAITLACSMPAYAQPSAFGGKEYAPPTAPYEPAAEPALNNEERISAAFEALDLKARVSQLMLVTLQGPLAPSSEDIAYLKDYTPGGVVVQQLLKPDHAAAYINQARNAAAASGIPLLVGANLYELGRPERQNPTAFSQLPSLMSVAAAEDADATAQLAKLIASQMHAMGFDFHLGPSLELAPALPEATGNIQNFGSNPRFTADAAGTLIDAFAASGVLPAPAGFPGGGANRVGYTPAVLLTPEPLLMENDLYPYVQAIQHNIRILHVGNVLVPSLDVRSRPASLSKAVMTTLLREKLRYEGVVIAGPLDSEDIVSQYPAAEAAVEALQGGADLLYWRGTDAAMMRVVDHVVRAVEEGRLSATVINAALKRVQALKQTLSENANREIRGKDISKLRNLDHECYTVERRAITLIKNSGQVLPLSRQTSLPLGVTGVVGVEELHAALSASLKGIAQQRIYSARHIGDIQSFEVNRITSRVEGARTVVCVFSDKVRSESQAQVVRELKKKKVNVVVVWLGYPQDIVQFAEADAILLAYCDSNNCGATIRAAADVLRGHAPVRILPAAEDLVFKVGEARTFDALEVVHVPAGRLPVTVSDLYPAGLSLPFDPNRSIRRVEWDFGDGQRATIKNWAKRYEAMRRKVAAESATAAKKQAAAKTKEDRRKLRESQEKIQARQQDRAWKFVNEQVVKHSFERPGRYPVTLRITDTKGFVTSQVFNVVVEE